MRRDRRRLLKLSVQCSPVIITFHFDTATIKLADRICLLRHVNRANRLIFWKAHSEMMKASIKLKFWGYVYGYMKYIFQVKCFLKMHCCDMCTVSAWVAFFLHLLRGTIFLRYEIIWECLNAIQTCEKTLSVEPCKGFSQSFLVLCAGRSQNRNFHCFLGMVSI